MTAMKNEGKRQRGRPVVKPIVGRSRRTTGKREAGTLVFQAKSTRRVEIS